MGVEIGNINNTQGNATITEAFKVTLNEGGYNVDDDVSVGTTFTEFAKKLLAPLQLPTVLANNSLSTTGVVAQTLEIGTLYEGSLKLTYNPGTIESKNDTPNIDLTGVSTTETFTGVGINSIGAISTQIVDGVNQWTGQVDHLQGTGSYFDSNGNVATNLDNLRVAGNISRTSPIITGMYKYWVHKGAVNTSPTTSTTVRALTEDGFAEPKTISTLITAGQREVSIYIPSTMQIDSVLLVESSNANITGTFTSSTITVNDANGVAVSYRKYTQDIGGTGYSTDVNYRITITNNNP